MHQETFAALILEQEGGETRHAIRRLGRDDLPAGR